MRLDRVHVKEKRGNYRSYRYSLILRIQDLILVPLKETQEMKKKINLCCVGCGSTFLLLNLTKFHTCAHSRYIYIDLCMQLVRHPSGNYCDLYCLSVSRVPLTLKSVHSGCRTCHNVDIQRVRIVAVHHKLLGVGTSVVETHLM